MRFTREQALSAARTLTGLTGMPTVGTGQAARDGVPFLSQQVAALGSVWELVWQGVRLSLPSARGMADAYERRVVVRLAQSTGQLLSATLATNTVVAGMRPTPGGDMAQEQLRRASESYKGLPPAPPRHSLLAALDAVQARGIGSPLQAAEIQALYVIHEHTGRAPIPAWVITLNGIPPLHHSGPVGAHVPVWQRNHIRNVVDANTGRPLYATTVPQPMVPRSEGMLVS